MAALIAAAPLAVILVGMGVLRRSAALAGSAGLVVALALVTTTFDMAERLRAGLADFGEALYSTATILWITLPALSLFEFHRRTGVRFRGRVAVASHHPRDTEELFAAGADLELEPFRDTVDRAVDVICGVEAAVRTEIPEIATEGRDVLRKHDQGPVLGRKEK